MVFLCLSLSTVPIGDPAFSPVSDTAFRRGLHTGKVVSRRSLPLLGPCKWWSSPPPAALGAAPSPPFPFLTDSRPEKLLFFFLGPKESRPAHLRTFGNNSDFPLP